MELTLAKRYPVAADRAQAWTVLGDLHAVAACMPGAQITEQVDASHFKGQVRARVGPASMVFQGEIELQERDPQAQRLRLLGKGSDKGGSAASLQLSAHLEAADQGCVLVGQATVKVSGKLAQIGNRLLVPASDALLAQFALNFSNAAAAATLAQANPVAPAAVATEAPALNAVALLWATLKAWWANLFKR